MILSYLNTLRCVVKFLSSHDSVAQIGRGPRFPFPQTDLSHGPCDGYAKRGESVHDRNTELKLGNLTSIAVLPFVTAQLDDVLRFDPKAGKLIAVADLRAIAGVPETRAGGRSNDYENPIRELRALRTSQGPALQGRNAEAKALQAEFEKQFPDMKCPSLPTAKRYVSKVRSGS